MRKSVDDVTARKKVQDVPEKIARSL